MSLEEENNGSTSAVRASYAWGQLFAGSLMSGLAVWKLLHKLTSTQPSVWFSGISIAYEEVRDFLALPLAHFSLSGSEKNFLLICFVMAGALLKGAMGYRFYRVVVILWFSTLVLGLFFPGYAQLVTKGLDGISEALNLRWEVLFISYVTVSFTLVPSIIWNLLAPTLRWIEPPKLHGRKRRSITDDMLKGANFVFFSFLFSVGAGAILLLLNWATS